MPFLNLFRSKEEKLAEAIAELHSNVVLATLESTLGIETALNEYLETTVDPKASYDLRCEIFCFYAHTLDFLSFASLGEHGRDMVMDYLIPLGIEPLVQSSLSNSGEEVREAHIADLLERFNTMTFEYSKSQHVMVSNFEQVRQQGGIPGVNDALSNEPEAKMSRLIQKVNGLLQSHIPKFGAESEFASEGAEAFGTNPESMGFITLCAIIQPVIYNGAAQADLRGKLRNLRSLIR